MKGMIVLLALLLSVGVLACEELLELPTPTPTPSGSTGPKLALISGTCGRIGDGPWVRCEGFVKNISGESLENIRVVILCHDDAGIPIASDSAGIDYDPILAGQQSPWSVLITYNPAFAWYGIEFKEYRGGTIPHRDDRPD